jgi:hypothetical protein
MFGTVGRAHVKPENREKLKEVMLGESDELDAPGYVNAYLMFPENREDEVLIVAMFADADSYWKNADAPAQHERYLEYRALMEDDPEWSDGEWFSHRPG